MTVFLLVILLAGADAPLHVTQHITRTGCERRAGEELQRLALLGEAIEYVACEEVPAHLLRPRRLVPDLRR
jgi:hypothetical protein